MSSEEYQLLQRLWERKTCSVPTQKTPGEHLVLQIVSCISIIRNIAINLARKGGYDSLTKAERFRTHNIDKLFLLLE